MTNVAFKLQDSGFTREQVDALTEFMTGSVATKEDMARLEGAVKEDIARLEGAVKEDMAALRGEVKEDITALRGEVKEDITALRTELKWIKAIGAAILAVLILPWLANFISAAMPS